MRTPEPSPHRWIDPDWALFLSLFQICSPILLAVDIGSTTRDSSVTFSLVVLLDTIFGAALCMSLGEAAVIRGYSRRLGWLGLFGLAGAIVIWALPDRDPESALRGFPVYFAARKAPRELDQVDDREKHP